VTDRSPHDEAHAENGPSAGNRPFWPAFVLASSLFAIFGGFLLGGYLFLLRAVSSRQGDWQAGAIQAHGHVQLFGWGGLMVLGVALHFLPRLLSARLDHPRLPWLVLWLMCGGLLLRVVAGPVLSTTSSALHAWAAGGLMLSAVCELTAVTIVVVLIATFFGRWRPRARNIPSLAVTALIGIAFTSLGAAMLINLIGAIETWTMSTSIIPFWADDATITLALTGFLTGVSLAMSARLFPLYVQTRLPRERLLRLAALALAAGLVLNCIGISTNSRLADGMGEILLAVSVTCAIVALNVFHSRRQLPRRRVRVLTDALQLHVVTAYLWLAVTALFEGLRGANQIGMSVWNPPLDAQRHALGAGFVTVLILGVGSEMLPGLARQGLRRPGLRWGTLVLANFAALARAIPLLVPSTNCQMSSAIMSGAGLLGAVAIGLFLLNVRPRIRVPPSKTAPAAALE